MQRLVALLEESVLCLDTLKICSHIVQNLFKICSQASLIHILHSLSLLLSESKIKFDKKHSHKPQIHKINTEY